MGGGGGKKQAQGGMFGEMLNGLLADEGEDDAPPPAVTPPTKDMPGYAGRPLQLFGGMSPDELAAYHAQQGIHTPSKPPRMPGR